MCFVLLMFWNYASIKNYKLQTRNYMFYYKLGRMCFYYNPERICFYYKPERMCFITIPIDSVLLPGRVMDFILNSKMYVISNQIECVFYKADRICFFPY